ncbi:unnamed protein product [Arctia plantaginis]|uniref:Uncharacterized protein n=1 Tax=Arctia plantaginis TaxID=874455 RepID=A0A8S1AVU7_ARCPL|nr:unnamed protein product [Arctia plantaginis]
MCEEEGICWIADRWDCRACLSRRRLYLRLRIRLSRVIVRTSYCAPTLRRYHHHALSPLLWKHVPARITACRM